MNPVDLVSKVVTDHREEQARALSAYRGLVRSVADGTEPTAAHLVDALTAAGKTADDLRRDVGAIIRRREDARKMADIPAIRQEMADLERKAQEAEAAFNPVAEKHKATIRELGRIWLAAKRRLEDAYGAPDRLKRSYPEDGPLHAEIGRLRAEAREIEGNIRALQAQANRTAPNEAIEDAMTWIRAENLGRATEGDTARAEAREAVHTAQRAAKLAEAAELAKKLVPIAARLYEIEETEMLVP